MTNTIVRQAAMADLDEVALLFDQYREFQGKTSDLSAARDFLKARFDHGESTVFLAHRGGTAVGFAQLYPSYSSVSLTRVFILNDLYVSAAGRRSGVASKLLAAVETYAWSLGAVRVSLNVARDNQPGQDLYDALAWVRDEQYFMVHRFAKK
jgi:GNAT superfamily N-acetyltransferase